MSQCKARHMDLAFCSRGEGHAGMHRTTPRPYSISFKSAKALNLTFDLYGTVDELIEALQWLPKEGLMRVSVRPLPESGAEI